MKEATIRLKIWDNMYLEHLIKMEENRIKKEKNASIIKKPRKKKFFIFIS
jgi:hypothetical protein